MRHFYKDGQMANKSVDTGEMQIKAPMRCHSLKTKHTNNSKCVVGTRNNWNSHALPVGILNGTALLEQQFGKFLHSETEPCNVPSNPTPMCLPKRNENLRSCKHWYGVVLAAFSLVPPTADRLSVLR